METTAINKNKAFDFKRFIALMKADLAVNKKNYLRIIYSGLGIFTAVALFQSIYAVIQINNLKHAGHLSGFALEQAINVIQNTYSSTYLVLSSLFFCIALTLLGSLTFNNLSTKRQRISSLMIPASQDEKFILQFLTYLVFGTIILIFGFLLGLGIIQIAFGGASVIFNDIISFLHSEYSGSIITAFILMALLGNSIYALGSSLWPKLSWVKTWVVMIALQWIGTIIMIALSATDISWRSFFMFWDGHFSLLQWTGLSILSILNIACWVLAWIRYRNTQIIQRFMTK